MNRVIKNYDPNSITQDFLDNNDWDIIVLNKKLNLDELRKWYNYVETNLSHLRFNVNENVNLLKHSPDEDFRTDTNDNMGCLNFPERSTINSYSMSWLVPRDVPLPPPWAADPNYFVELKEFMDDEGNWIKDIDYTRYVYLEQYMFGEFEEMVNDWIDEFAYNPRITQHLTGHVIPDHTDEGYSARIHIPITDDHSLFHYGETSYKLEPGKIYLINSRITHSTSNPGPETRSNIMADIKRGKIKDLVCLL